MISENELNFYDRGDIKGQTNSDDCVFYKAACKD